MNTHLSWEQLNDYADGDLAPDTRASAERHLESCADCRATLAKLRAVLIAAADVPAAIDAPDGAWAVIKTQVERTKMVELPVSSAKVVAVRRGSRWVTAAAAVALIVVSSALTAIFMQKQAQVASTPSDTAVRAIPASVEQIDKDYLNTVDALTSTLKELEGKLSPETVKAVMRSLKTIDNAIQEARNALLRDPANEQLRQLLEKHYQLKVSVLRRASARAT